jgi:hypothetical protein
MGIHVTVEARNQADIDAAPMLYEIEYRQFFRRADLLHITLEIEPVLLMLRHYTKSTMENLLRCANQSFGSLKLSVMILRRRAKDAIQN